MDRTDSLEEILPEPLPEGELSRPSQPERSALRSQQRSQVLKMIAELSPGDQLFVRLFYYQDATIDEVSRVMRISRNAAYVRKMRLHRRLRSLLEKNS